MLVASSFIDHSIISPVTGELSPASASAGDGPADVTGPAAAIGVYVDEGVGRAAEDGHVTDGPAAASEISGPDDGPLTAGGLWNDELAVNDESTGISGATGSVSKTCMGVYCMAR